MEDHIQLAMEERIKYVEICKDLITREISKFFRTIPLASRVEFFMDMPNFNIPYRDNPIISELNAYTSQNIPIKSEENNKALGNLNLIMHLCGMGLIQLFPCGRVMFYREHYLM